MTPAPDGATDWRRTWHGLHAVLGRKWALHVLRSLAARERGFNDLQRDLGGVTARTLSARLSALTCAGFVEREVTGTRPPSTTYRLTGAGRLAVSHLTALEALARPATCEDGDGRESERGEGAVCCAVLTGTTSACDCEATT